MSPIRKGQIKTIARDKAPLFHRNSAWLVSLDCFQVPTSPFRIRAGALASQARQTPEFRAKQSAVHKGKTPPRHVIEAARRAKIGMKHTEEARRKMSEAHKRHGTRPPGSGEPWTPEEDALLGTMMDKDVAARLGVGKQAVFERRTQLDIPSFREQRGYKACREPG